MRLIDADVLKTSIQDHFDNLDVYYPSAFITEVEDAPTVKPCENCDLYFTAMTKKESEIIKAYTKGFDTGVETVKRPQGKWISRGNGSGINYGRSCSLCGKVVEFSENYCPNCGADMRKDEEDG